MNVEVEDEMNDKSVGEIESESRLHGCRKQKNQLEILLFF